MLMTREMTATIPRRVRIVQGAAWVFERWYGLWLLIFALFNLLPWLAPLFMEWGIAPLGNAIYGVYGLISHQFAHRSYFLFGEQVMYSPTALPLTLTGDFSADGTVLGAFVGDSVFGYKIAWSDRLVALYGAGLVTTLTYGLLRERDHNRRFPWWLMLLFVLPLIMDGTLHVMSEADGLTGGWRWYNRWLVLATGGSLGGSFYTGDALGSFNWWIRLVTGILAGIGIMAWLLGIAEGYFARNANILKGRLADWQARQSQSIE